MSKRYDFLDGIRALAALAVFSTHAYSLQFDAQRDNLLIGALFSTGDPAVVSLIVLSGFCLGLQLHRQQTFWAYIGRRSRRILPTYYGAVAVCCLLLIARAKLHGIDLQLSLAALAPNLLLVKDLFQDRDDWLIGSIVFWSIGLEYRLYWLLPVMAWCDKHWGRMGVAAFAVWSTAVALLLCQRLNLAPSHVWYIVLFALGAIASQSLQCRLPTLPLALALTTFLAAILTRIDLLAPTIPTRIAIDLAWGAMLAVLMLHWAQKVDRGQQGSVMNLLSCRWLGWLAGWSYSLYLMHYALLRYSYYWLFSHHLHGWQAIGLAMSPVMVGCYLFSLVFEQPFVKR